MPHPTRRPLLAALLPLLLCQAGADRAVPQFLGFSPDGRSAALAVNGVEDGSGVAYANIWLVDSASNTLIQNWERSTGENASKQSAEDNRELVFRRAAETLTQRGLGERFQGTVLWKRSPPPLTARPSSEDLYPNKVPGRPKVPPTKNTPVSFGGKTWTFGLTQLPFGPHLDCPPSGQYGGFSRGLTLTVSSAVKPGSTLTTTMQSDIRVPLSRVCAFHYELTEVRVQGDYLAATVAIYLTSPFEAKTNIRYMLITARRPDR